MVCYVLCYGCLVNSLSIYASYHSVLLYILYFHFSPSASLYELADLLIEKGVINAINLDGGGSATFLEDGVLRNFPSDHW